LSAFIGPDQDTTETLLASDPDVAPWVQKYQRSRETVSRTDYEVSLFIYIYISLTKGSQNSRLFSLFSYLFQVDLITTFTKLSTLGQKINYEAYTYPRAKIDITKLKL
jgi:L-ascorbate peroxidase